MRTRRAFLHAAILAVCACIAVYVRAYHLFPERPPPRHDLEDWLDVWATYKLEAIPTKPEPHVVQPGETLWDVAEKYRLPGDIRMTVDIIRELNSLWGAEGPRLRPGQRLKVPETDESEWPEGMRWCWGRR